MPERARQRMTEVGVERQCRRCGQWWLLQFFRPNPRCRGGRVSVCNECRNKRDRELRKGTE